MKTGPKRAKRACLSTVSLSTTGSYQHPLAWRGKGGGTYKAEGWSWSVATTIKKERPTGIVDFGRETQRRVIQTRQGDNHGTRYINVTLPFHMLSTMASINKTQQEAREKQNSIDKDSKAYFWCQSRVKRMKPDLERHSVSNTLIQCLKTEARESF